MKLRSTVLVAVAATPYLAHPYYGKPLLDGDIWIGYSRRLRSGYEWSVQLSARNLIGSKNYIPVPDIHLAAVKWTRPTVRLKVHTLTKWPAGGGSYSHNNGGLPTHRQPWHRSRQSPKWGKVQGLSWRIGFGIVLQCPLLIPFFDPGGRSRQE